MRDVDGGFRAMDPARGRTGLLSAPERRALLDRVLTTPREHRTARPGGSGTRRWGLALAVAAAATAAALAVPELLGPAAQPAYAVTPEPLALHRPGGPAGDVLEALARQVEKLPDDSPNGGTERFVQDSWSLSTRVDGIQVTSAIVPERRVTWKRPDGSETWRVRSLAPRFATAEQRRTWEDAGSLGGEPRESSDSTGPADPADPRNQEPPADPAGMGRWLRAGYETRGAGEFFDSVAERHIDNHFSPVQRAALLRALAAVRGVEYRGMVTDRAGRSGHAFSVASSYGGLPKVQTLVFDPHGGDLLSYDEQLTTDAGALNVRVPAVVLYIDYLSAG
ncbi:CU044_5270 family protein [Streptomyces sp. NPDC026673]|uniref:CU044_5270 family protein n=1 Tax=Streptomyces sp. NPDC026673 TaxID=3155724 RepID=UPI003407D05B